MKRRTGFVVAGAIAGVGLIVGVAIAVIGGMRVGSVDGVLPTLREIPADATSDDIEMRPGLEWRVFALVPAAGSGPEVTCSGPGVTVREPSTRFTYTRNSVEWERALILTVDQPGTYAVTCTAVPGPGSSATRLAIQDAVDPNSAGTLLTGVAAIVVGAGVVVVGIIVGGIVALFAGLRGRRT